MNIEGLEKERDFYFGKLRDIEVLCQDTENESVLPEKVLNVLYATEVRLFLCYFILPEQESVF